MRSSNSILVITLVITNSRQCFADRRSSSRSGECLTWKHPCASAATTPSLMSESAYRLSSPRKFRVHLVQYLHSHIWREIPDSAEIIFEDNEITMPCRLVKVGELVEYIHQPVSAVGRKFRAQPDFRLFR